MISVKEFTKCRTSAGRSVMRQHFEQIQGAELAWHEWGAGHSGPPIVIVHGLGGQSHNAAPLAGRLARDFRVLCPDLPGRGLSAWATNPEAEYCFAAYLARLCAWLDRLGIDTVHWIGTSMGGALGIRAAATALRERIVSLTINDVGPTLDDAVAASIAGAIGQPPRFGSLAELTDYLADFLGKLGARQTAIEHWRRSAVFGSRRMDDGRFTLHYDPRIALQFRHHRDDYEQWALYDSVTTPTLLIHGTLSTVLSSKVAQEMTRRGPRAELHSLEGWGHAPFLDGDEDARLIRNFLLHAKSAS